MFPRINNTHEHNIGKMQGNSMLQNAEQIKLRPTWHN